MKRVGIVGHEAAKFTAATEAEARELIRYLLREPCVMVSGACPLGGIDIWAEEEADKLGREKLIFPPKKPSWEGGFKPRNLQIATESDEVHNVVVAQLPSTYRGMRFSRCYHCDTTSHVKSGGCWTAKQAQNRGKPATWHIVGAPAPVAA